MRDSRELGKFRDSSWPEVEVLHAFHRQPNELELDLEFEDLLKRIRRAVDWDAIVREALQQIGR